MRVEELMSSAECCDERDTVFDCARLMKEESIGFVPICNENDEPIGAVTDRDLVIRVLAEGRSPDEQIVQFMTRDLVRCRIGDDLEEAERLMREERKSRIVVCDAQGKLAGVISLHDLSQVEEEESTGQTLQEVKSDQPAAHH
jgi:CBS domain-containing protein